MRSGSKHGESALVRKLNKFLVLSQDEIDCLAGMQARPVQVKRGQHLVREGQTDHQAFVLQDGWACSSKDLCNGSRQIVSLPIAGDCVGLRSVLLRTADHSLSTLTDAIVSPVDGDHMMSCITRFPRLGAALLWAASRDEAMVVEHLVSLGRRSALERTAHFFMELAERLRLIGEGTEGEFRCPLSQFVIADTLGLTAIHVNRMLRQLRELRVVTLKAGVLKILDLAALRKLSGFQGGYLEA